MSCGRITSLLLRPPTGGPVAALASETTVRRPRSSRRTSTTRRGPAQGLGTRSAVPNPGIGRCVGAAVIFLIPYRSWGKSLLTVYAGSVGTYPDRFLFSSSPSTGFSCHGMNGPRSDRKTVSTTDSVRRPLNEFEPTFEIQIRPTHPLIIPHPHFKTSTLNLGGVLFCSLVTQAGRHVRSRFRDSAVPGGEAQHHIFASDR